MNFVLGTVLVLGLLILVHEWGHFVVARLFGVRVDVFSIGFGPRLFGWKRGATDYRVSALPLGGYVRMAGQDLSEVDAGTQAPTGSPDELMSKPRWQRALITLAGPAVNLLFPIVLLTGFYMLKGDPYLAFLDLPVQVQGVPSSATAGPDALRAGDRLLNLNGIQNPTWEQGFKLVESSPDGTRLSAQVDNSGSLRNVDLVVHRSPTQRPVRPFGYLPIRAVIGEIIPGEPADRAGLRENDRIVEVNGQPIQWWDQFVDSVRNSKGSRLNLSVERKEQTLALSVTPKQNVLSGGEAIFQIGVGPIGQYSYHKLSPVQSLRAAISKSMEAIQGTVQIVGGLLAGKISIRQLQGPVGITYMAGKAVEETGRKGPLALVSLIVLLSVNLGILNLLPIPILDGGNILLLSIEGALRRDLSLRFKERFVQVGLFFLLVLFAIVMYNDILRRLPSHS
jgi:regulator of sigma E protease